MRLHQNPRFWGILRNNFSCPSITANFGRMNLGEFISLCNLGLGPDWDTGTSCKRQPVPLGKQGKAAFPTWAAPAGTQLMSPTLLQNPPRLLWCHAVHCREPGLPTAPTLGTPGCSPGGSADLSPQGGGFPSPSPSLQPSLPFPCTTKSPSAGTLHPGSPCLRPHITSPPPSLWLSAFLGLLVFFFLFPVALGKLWDTKKHQASFYRGTTKAHSDVLTRHKGRE